MNAMVGRTAAGEIKALLVDDEGRLEFSVNTSPLFLIDESYLVEEGTPLEPIV